MSLTRRSSRVSEEGWEAPDSWLDEIDTRDANTYYWRSRTGHVSTRDRKTPYLSTLPHLGARS